MVYDLIASSIAVATVNLNRMLLLTPAESLTPTVTESRALTVLARSLTLASPESYVVPNNGARDET